MNHELEPSTESVPASQMFRTEEQMAQEAVQTISTGQIKIIEASQVNQENADITPYIRISEGELDKDKIELNEYEKKQPKVFRNGAFGDFSFKNPTDAAQKSREVTHEAIIDSVLLDNQWHLNEVELGEDLQNGKVTQLFEISLDDERKVPIINFSDSLLSEDQLNSLHDAITRVTNSTGSGIFKILRAICIQPSERFKNGTVGSVRGASGVVRLNEILLDNPEGYIKHREHGITPLQSTTTHELGHLVELLDKSPANFSKAIGWRSEGGTVIDDYGQVAFTSRYYLDRPFTVEVSKDGEVQEAKADEFYGKSAVEKAAPVTGYGYTNPREDFAEGFVPYTYAASEDTVALDALRRNATAGILQRGSGGEYGPFQVRVEPLPLTTVFGANIKPKTYSLAKPRYSVVITNPGLDQDPTKGYGIRYHQFIDDYGNVQHRPIRQPNYS
jgi:hypothetical protein